MKKKFCVLAVVLSFTFSAFGKDNGKQDQLDRLQSAATVLDEIMAAPDKGVPEEILRSAKCVAVVPSMLKGGFVVGAAYGRGVATCRMPDAPAKWSAPAFFRVEGGSFGLQIGAQAVDLVMLIMNENGMRALLSSKAKVGADTSAAAGPVGRHAEGMTDWKMRAEVLTYSRARGVFAGVALNGAVISQDDDDTRALYGEKEPFSQILTGKVHPPAGADKFLATVKKYSAEDKTNAKAESH